MLRLLVAQRLADTAGLPGADRQGVYEPQELAASVTLGKLAARVAPPSVKRHLAEQEAERERREQTYQERQAARLKQQREKLAAGELRPLRLLQQPDRERSRSRREARRTRPRRRLRTHVGQARSTTDEEAD